MKYALPLAFALIVLLPSCASQSDTALSAQSVTAPAPRSADVSTLNSESLAGGSPMTVYRGAQQVAGALNTVRTFGSLF